MKKFLTELRRRRVFTVAAAYVVVGWLLIQVADTLFPIFGAPDWVLKVFTALIFLGFPIAMVLTWAFDVTPQGVVRTESDPKPSDQSNSIPDDQSKPAEGIAVLPFVSMSQDLDDEHLADGIAEEIINALAQIPGLKVAARTSAFSFKGQNIDLKEVGARLGVRRVLEGSLRHSGNQLRVTAQLINAADGYHVWSEKYDRELTDIFAIQDEIAQAIAARISTSTGGSSIDIREEHFTDNIDAYQLYLKAKWCWSRAGGNFGEGMDLVDQARKLDPEFAQAHAWFAIMQVYVAFFGFGKGIDYRDSALEAAQRALSCNDKLAICHDAMGLTLQYLFYDWEGTEKHYRKALELMPGDAMGASWAGVFLHRFPKHSDEALALCRRSVVLDPLSGDHHAILAWVLWSSGEYEEALQYTRSARQMHPFFPFAYASEAGVLTSMGNHTEAISIYDNAPESVQADPLFMGLAAWSLGRAGQPEKAQEYVSRMKQQRESGYFGAAFLSIACIGAGDPDSALDWMEKAVDEHDGLITYAVNMAPFNELRAEPRFKAMLRRMNLSHC
ncbi:MAG TPA: tetratricopeptide repeat protein [Xanthomonadales bacterium]|nr:tetratricopeptide repeat protein [Xanthomonadales bacterium]